MGHGPAALAVEDRLFDALAVLRGIVLLNTVVLSFYRPDDFARPIAGWLCVAAMVGWTALATWAYAQPARRTPLLLVADLALAVGLLLISPVVKGEGFQATVPGFWVMAALLAWAVHWRWRGGLVAAVALAAADLVIREQISQSNYGNVFLLLLGGPIVGYMVASLQRMADERDIAQRAAAASAERARLARAVHDGVLQVLALVQRRGVELGGEVAELGRLAGEQEAALRTLIQRQDALAADGAPGLAGEADLADELARVAGRPGITLALPGRPVLLEAETTHELVAAVAACLDNVAVHVGDRASAWVLLEELEDRVEVSVRDEGPGIPEGRLERAEADGRLGISQSVRGRLAELGGSAELHSDASGTEWTLSVPRRLAE